MLNKELQTASKLPKIPHYMTFIAGLCMAGFRIIPEEYHKVLGEKFNKIDLELLLTADGVQMVYNNEWKSGPHYTWQNLTLPEKYPEGTVVIPVNELQMLANGDMNRSFASLCRIMIDGDNIQDVVERILAIPELNTSMKIFATTCGYGINADTIWTAAQSEAQATEIVRPLTSLQVRKTHFVRDVTDEDEITGPGMVMFSGFGPHGPAIMWPVS